MRAQHITKHTNQTRGTHTCLYISKTLLSSAQGTGMRAATRMYTQRQAHTQASSQSFLHGHASRTLLESWQSPGAHQSGVGLPNEVSKASQ